MEPGGFLADRGHLVLQQIRPSGWPMPAVGAVRGTAGAGAAAALLAVASSLAAGAAVLLAAGAAAGAWAGSALGARAKAAATAKSFRKVFI